MFIICIDKTYVSLTIASKWLYLLREVTDNKPGTLQNLYSMELAIRIRNIEELDFEYIYSSLCDLENQILDVKALKEIFNANITNKKYLYLIAESEATKVGFITFHTQNLMHHVGLVGEIQEFYISPEYRGKGVGRQLVAKIITYSEEHQLKSIEVQTNRKRVENVAIYESLGFNLSHNKFTIYR